VCDLSGTTRDAVDTTVTLPDGTRLTLIDTAGIRKRARVADSKCVCVKGVGGALVQRRRRLLLLLLLLLWELLLSVECTPPTHPSQAAWF
jgi:GTPase